MALLAIFCFERNDSTDFFQTLNYSLQYFLVQMWHISNSNKKEKTEKNVQREALCIESAYRPCGHLNEK